MPERMLEELNKIQKQNEQIREETVRVWERLRVHRLERIGIAVLLIAVMVLSFLRWRDEVTERKERERNDARIVTVLDCVRQWAKTTADRQELLTKLANERTIALDKLIRAVASSNRAQFQAALKAYLDASNRYLEASSKNPVPPPPELTCSELTSQPLSLPTVTRTVPPTATTTRTATRTVTPVRTVTAVRTAVRQVPGPVRTRVVVQTVTVRPGRATVTLRVTVPPGRR